MNTVLVNEVVGTAWIRNADGSLTQIQSGMRIPENANIVTEAGSRVELAADGVPVLTIGEGRDLALAPDVFNPNVDAFGAAIDPTQAVDPAIAQILATLEEGGDILEGLDATAAVLTAAGGEGGGSSFTRLLSIVETTSPLALAYPRPVVDTPEAQILGGTGTDAAPAAAPAVGTTVPDEVELEAPVVEPETPIDPETPVDPEVPVVPDPNLPDDTPAVFVDTTPPEVVVTINDDGTVSFEFSEVIRDFDQGDLEIENGVLTDGSLTQDANDPRKWTAEFTPNPNLEGEVKITVPANSYEDLAGNKGGEGSDQKYFDTLPPEADIAIDTIAGDDVINAQEAADVAVAISGTVGKDVKAGDLVTVTVGTYTGTTFVTGTPDNLVWTLNVPGATLAENTQVDASVTIKDAAGNSATAKDTRGYGVDTDLPEASITIDTIAGDDVINQAESNGDVTLGGSVGHDVKKGDTVTVTIGDQSYTTQVQATGTWSVVVPGDILAENTQVEASVTIKDAAGNSITADADRVYSVDTTLPEEPSGLLGLDVSLGDLKYGEARYSKDGELLFSIEGDKVSALGDSVTISTGPNFTNAKGNSTSIFVITQGDWTSLSKTVSGSQNSYDVIVLQDSDPDVKYEVFFNHKNGHATITRTTKTTVQSIEIKNIDNVIDHNGKTSGGEGLTDTQTVIRSLDIGVELQSEGAQYDLSEVTLIFNSDSETAVILDANGNKVAVSGAEVTLTSEQLEGMQVHLPDGGEATVSVTAKATSADGEDKEVNAEVSTSGPLEASGQNSWGTGEDSDDNLINLLSDYNLLGENTFDVESNDVAATSRTTKDTTPANEENSTPSAADKKEGSSVDVETVLIDTEDVDDLLKSLPVNDKSSASTPDAAGTVASKDNSESNSSKSESTSSFDSAGVSSMQIEIAQSTVDQGKNIGDGI